MRGCGNGGFELFRLVHVSSGDELPYDTVKSPGDHSTSNKKRNPYHSLYDYKEQNKTWIDKILTEPLKASPPLLLSYKS